MWCFRGSGGGGRELLSKALSCVPLVIFWLLFMATPVTAQLVANESRSVSSAVQEPLLTDETHALQNISTALNRNVDLLQNNFSWIKVALLQMGFLFLIEMLKIFTGVLTQSFVDCLRKAVPWWNSQMPPTLEKDLLNVFVLQLAACMTVVADLRAQLAAALDWIATTTAYARRQLAACANEVADLRAQLAAALDRMATTTAYARRQLAACANEVADLRAQLAAALNRMATTTAYARRQLAACANEVADLRAQLAAALNRMATTIAYARRQLAVYANHVADLRAQVADLRSQLAAALDRMATATADAERKEEETNRKVDELEERFESFRRQNSTTFIWPEVENPLKEGVITAAGFLSDSELQKAFLATPSGDASLVSPRLGDHDCEIR